MNDVQQQAEQLIYRAMNLQEFVVLREENDMILNGVIRYDIRHDRAHLIVSLCQL
jgi:hypothetical protein